MNEKPDPDFLSGARPGSVSSFELAVCAKGIPSEQ